MTTISIGGWNQPLVLSLHAWKELAEKYGSLNGFNEELRSGDELRILSAVETGLDILIRAGRAYVDPEDLPPALEGTPADYLTGADIQPAVQAIAAALMESVERKVETQPPKNGKATQR